MELLSYQKRAWADINIDLVRYNFQIIKKRTNGKTKICCVVKANAYGHGAVCLGKVYEEEGADYLAVSNIEEALQLRKNGIKLPILILGFTNPSCAYELCKNDIMQCVFSPEYGKELASYARANHVVVKCHLKIDTGMGRIGFKSDGLDLKNAVETCKMDGLFFEGIFTHFSSSDEGNSGRSYTQQQFNAFINSIDFLKQSGIDFRIRHCSNSAAVCDYPEYNLDMVRAGIILYGLQPSSEILEPIDVKPVLQLKTLISHIKTAFPGDNISYGREYTPSGKSIIATIPIGYADGLWRANYQNQMRVCVEGKPASIVGRICMDQCMIDITNIPKAHLGSIVTVYGIVGDNSIDAIAKRNKTINYEVLCAIGERVPRVYYSHGQVISIKDCLLL